MALIELRVNPTARDLKWFGLILLAFFGLIGVLVWRATGSLDWPKLIWGAAALLSLAYYVAKPVRRPMYVGWSYVTYPIGWVVSHALMGVVFFGLFTAVGLVFRMMGRDSMTRRRQSGSYWAPRDQSTRPADYLRQY